MIVAVDVREECAVAVALGACAPAPSIGRSIAVLPPSPSFECVDECGVVVTHASSTVVNDEVKTA